MHALGQGANLQCSTQAATWARGCISTLCRSPLIMLHVSSCHREGHTVQPNPPAHRMPTESHGGHACACSSQANLNAGQADCQQAKALSPIPTGVLSAHASSSHIVLEGAVGQAAHNVGVHHSLGQLDLPRGAVFSAPDMCKHLCTDDLQQVQGVVRLWAGHLEQAVKSVSSGRGLA